MTAAALAGGFAAPPLDAARAFRAALDAMARPGRIVDLAGAAPPPPLSPAAGALLLALADADTPLWLGPSVDTPQTRAWIAFHTGAARATRRADAAFAVGRWDELAPLDGFARGTPERPDRSATLIVETDRLEPRGARLRGPGIRGAAELSLPDLAPARAAAGAFPLGLDVFLTAGTRAAALPRSTRIEAPCT